ncbi:MAG: hypothetical protein WA921_14875 [Ahrensia sp.]
MNQTIITRDEADEKIEGNIEETDPSKDLAIAQARLAAVDVDGRREYYKLRRDWSDWIIFWIGGLIVFNIFLTIFVGSGMLDFREYRWFITAVTIETFLQIVGMGYIAVKFLFSNSSID